MSLGTYIGFIVAIKISLLATNICHSFLQDILPVYNIFLPNKTSRIFRFGRFSLILRVLLNANPNSFTPHPFRQRQTTSALKLNHCDHHPLRTTQHAIRYPIRSTINAINRNNKYMLVQRYICQAALFPSDFHTRHAPRIIHSPSRIAETR